MSDIQTTCPYCGVGCGVSVGVDTNKPTQVLASQTHPANFGKLCSKGSALAETLEGTEGNRESSRLTYPRINGEVASWGQATSTVAARIQESIAKHGKDSVAFYLSGQLLTEDYYVANKLMKGFIGTANVDTNSRLCMSSAVAAYKRAFGSDTVPCSYEDLECADLIVLIGSNAAWTHPVLYQRMVAAKENKPNLRVVLIDPRNTASADLADIHLQLTPGSDGFLFQGLLNYLVNTEQLDKDYIDAYTEGFEQLAPLLATRTVAETARKTGVSEKLLADFFELFAETKKTVSFYSQGINQSATGTDKCNAIINCHLATGKIGFAGAGPFSITGQPNAMGGREVGGLANMLAAHMGFSVADTDRVQRFWKSPVIAKQAGLKAVDLFDSVHRGDIKVLWIMATNPAVSLPNSRKVREALARCETVIVSDVTNTDTSEYADILLPALAWGEKDGTVTNSERRISRQRAFMKGPGTAKADWWTVSQVAQKMGFVEQFSYRTARDVFVEHAQLSSFENQGTRDFDISALKELSEADYQALKPVQWPVTDECPEGTQRMFADGKFFTKSGRAQFVSSEARHPLAVMEAKSNAHLLVLNSGRLRDQWHTMTRTGLAPTLSAHDNLPCVQIHPEDALQQALQHDGFVTISNRHGRAVFRVDVSKQVNRGELFAPIHWSNQFATQAVVNDLVPAIVDPESGQPESKACAVSVEPFECKHWARLVTRQRISKAPEFSYWASNRFESGYISVIGFGDELDWQAWLTEHVLVQEGLKNSRVSNYVNPLSESQSWLLSEGDKLAAMAFSARSANSLPSDAWLRNAFTQGVRSGLDKQLGQDLSRTLRGEQGGADAVICACFSTSRKNVVAAYQNGARSIAELGAQLGCGSKCGSCKPELNQLMCEQNLAN